MDNQKIVFLIRWGMRQAAQHDKSNKKELYMIINTTFFVLQAKKTCHSI